MVWPGGEGVKPRQLDKARCMYQNRDDFVPQSTGLTKADGRLCPFAGKTRQLPKARFIA